MSKRVAELDSFIRDMPKVELHLHIEGTLEPELMFDLAHRNGVTLPYGSLADVRRAYEFTGLQSFLDVYYAGAHVLQHERDFYDLTWAYLTKVNKEHVRHTEIFFDPQAHTGRGVTFETVVSGIRRALEQGERDLGITSRLIMCFLRHLNPEAAMDTLDQSLPFKNWITAVGLDSSERDNPPHLFAPVFDRARSEGFRRVAHAGEEGPPAYIWQALDLLGAERIDHGVRSIEDPQLIARLRAEEIPLTVCPLSNVRLHVFDRIEEHNLKRLLGEGLRVTVNSDDPAYFGGYVTANLLAVQRALSLDHDDICLLGANAIDGSFLPADQKKLLKQELQAFAAAT